MLFIATLLTVVATSAFDSARLESKLGLISSILMMGEDIFKLENRDACLEKTFCLMESEMRSEMRNPLKHISRVFTNDHGDFEVAAFSRLDSLVRKKLHFSKMVAAMKLGQDSNATTCQAAYYCQIPSYVIVDSLFSMNDENALKRLRNIQKRDCNAGGIGCGVVGLGCAGCSGLTLGECAVLCAPEVAATCGAGGVWCGI